MTPMLFCTWPTSMKPLVMTAPAESPPTATSHASFVLSGLVELKDDGAVRASAIVRANLLRAFRITATSEKEPNAAEPASNEARSTLARSAPGAEQPGAGTVEQNPPAT